MSLLLRLKKARQYNYVAVLVCSFAILSTSCSVAENNNLSNNSDVSVLMSPPPQLLSARAINIDELVLTATVGTNITMGSRVSDNEWNLTIIGELGETAAVDIVWSEDLDETLRLGLLQFSTEVTFNQQSQEISISQDQFDSTVFDNDDDGVSNFQEIAIDETDPTNNNLCSACRTDIDTTVRRIEPGFAPPVIDGAYGNTGVWDQAQFKDRDGLLLVDSVLVDQTGSLGESPYRWFTMHDGTHLYIMVFGRTGAGKAYVSDSSNEEVFHDESLEIFIGGDPTFFNSDIPDEDDYQFSIPIVTRSLEANGSGRDDNILVRGPNSNALPQIDFSNFIGGEGVDTWEVRIPLAGVGIVEGREFGIEVEVNLDIDGGDREVKWGWAHPEGFDMAYRNPSLLGRAVLE